MTNEFKKVSSNKDQTVYTLESASSGGTSAGSIASVSSPMGGVQKRGQLVTSGTEKKIPSSTPRNFVAKNAKTGGAGAHKDKKKDQKQGTAKHKKPYMEALQTQLDQLKFKLAEVSDATKASYKEKATQQVKDLKPHAKKGEYKDIAQRMISRREKGIDKVTSQGVAEGSRDDDEYGPKAREEWLKQQAYEKEYNKKKPSTPVKPANKSKEQGVAEGDAYMESLQAMVERQLEPTMDLDAWNDNFQNADPQKYHQFKNKSPEKKK